jgi:hypothetical protein
MIVGPVRKVSTPEGTILVTLDAFDGKYILWGAYDKLTLTQLAARGIDLNRPADSLELEKRE